MSEIKIQSLQRAFSILELFRVRNSELSFKEIQEVINLPKGTVYRFLSDLENAGFIGQDKISKKYRLGLKLLELGMIVHDQIDIRKKAFPFLEELRKLSNENVNLGALEGNEVIYLERLESVRLLRLNARVGSRVPIHCSSIGKILIAYQPEQMQKELIEKLDMYPHTSRTITSKEKFLEEIIKVREQGFAISDRELLDEVRTVAVPIFNHLGEVEVACNVSAPDYRLPFELIETTILPLLIKTGNSISKSVGYNC